MDVSVALFGLRPSFEVDEKRLQRLRKGLEIRQIIEINHNILYMSKDIS